MAFKKLEFNQSYLKSGFLGLQGSGKTFTAADIAVGLHNLLKDRGLPGGHGKVYMVDSETGSNWLAENMKRNGIELQVDQTRAFATLLEDMDQVARVNGILIIDSITHFWQELIKAYMAKKPEWARKRITFDDWGKIKQEWAPFTERYLTHPSHILMLGRQGYEYSHYEDEDGKKQIEKSGVKMKGETETGYEPSLLVLMQREQEMDENGKMLRVIRTATVLKDRSNQMDGAIIENPTFKSFLPHISTLNLGGDMSAFDPKEGSEHLFIDEGERTRLHNIRKIALEELKQAMLKAYPSQSAADKQGKFELLEQIFQTRSWTLVEKLGIDDIKTGYEKICAKFGWKPLTDSDITEKLDGEAVATPSGDQIPW